MVPNTNVHRMKIERPFELGVYFGMGLIIAPFFLMFLMACVLAFFGVIGSAVLDKPSEHKVIFPRHIERVQEIEIDN
jgi:hypothetical protein